MVAPIPKNNIAFNPFALQGVSTREAAAGRGQVGKPAAGVNFGAGVESGTTLARISAINGERNPVIASLFAGETGANGHTGALDFKA